MPDNITVIGLNELIESLSTSHELVQRVGKKHLRDWAIEGVTLAQIAILNEGAVDTNELIQGMHYELHGLEAVIRPSDKADQYAYYVEEGSPPHWPPISALQGWADRHGIPVYAVARKIAREGTSPRKVFEQAYQDLDAHIDSSELSRLAEEIARNL